jgi:hypothetical protein
VENLFSSLIAARESVKTATPCTHGLLVSNAYTPYEEEPQLFRRKVNNLPGLDAADAPKEVGYVREGDLCANRTKGVSPWQAIELYSI